MQERPILPEVLTTLSPGPDASNTLSLKVSTDEGTKLELRFFGSVLHMRGDKVTPQPLVSIAGDVLLWNGEIFDGVEVCSFLRRREIATSATLTSRCAGGRTRE